MMPKPRTPASTVAIMSLWAASLKRRTPLSTLAQGWINVTTNRYRTGMMGQAMKVTREHDSETAAEIDGMKFMFTFTRNQSALAECDGFLE
jgi:hypothetical protein